MEWFDTLVKEFREASTWVEVAIIAACLLISYLLSSTLAKRVNKPESIWLGPTAVQGVMFPLLSLVLVYVSTVIVEHYEPVFLLRAMVSVLTSLVLVRWTAKVLAAAFPHFDAAALAGADVQALRACGLSQPKVRTIHALAAAVAAGAGVGS